MTIPKVGAGSQPEQGGNSGKKAVEQQNQETKSIFAEFNDADNKVDISDVKYIAHNNVLRQSDEIKSFLTKHSGKDWTDALKEQINNLITRFNMECEGDAELEDGRSSVKKFREKERGDFESFKKDANQTIIDFNDEIKKENDDFKKQCINEILNNLKSGQDGYINLNGIGTIQYDKEKNSFVLERQNNKQTVVLDDEKLNKIIQIAIEHKVYITGTSSKENSYSKFQG